jgi:hypothetical protein
MAVHACNPSTQKLREVDHELEFKASLYYTRRPYLKKKKPERDVYLENHSIVMKICIQ